MAFVLVEFDFEYKAKDGRHICIKPNERYVLVSKTNDHWWRVSKDQDSKPFYIPAEYVKEVSAPPGTSSGPKKTESPKSLTKRKPADATANLIQCLNEASLVCTSKTSGYRTGRIRILMQNLNLNFNTKQCLNNGKYLPVPLCHNNKFCTSGYSPDLESKVRNHLFGTRPSCEFVILQMFKFPSRKTIYQCSFKLEENANVGDIELSASLEQRVHACNVQNENLRSAVYVNVAELRQSISESPPSDPSPCSPSYLKQEGWEVHVDQESGQEYYYHPDTGSTTWDNPFLDSPTDPEPLPPEVPFPPPSPQSDWASDWEQLVDETTGSTPPGWNLTVEPSGTWVFTSENSPDQWIKSVDDQGQTYYYLRDGTKSEWNLPEYKPREPRENQSLKIRKMCRRKFHPLKSTTHYKRSSCEVISKHVQNLEKAGILNKTKISENGKKVSRKNWVPTWTVLHGGVLTFHKDPKPSPGAVNKTNQIVPEFTVELKGATIGWATKDKSSKKNVLELKGKNGVEFLIQYDTESIIHDWHKILKDTIQQLVSPGSDQNHQQEVVKDYQEHHSEEEDGDLPRPSISQSPNNAGETDPKKVRTKLMKFLMKRPTLQSVKEKGYIRENVFGCHLHTLCAHERTTVPSFVDKCIKAVERRGLDIDGLYRVSGNLAVIQKLRFKADHAEELDLEDGQWEDVHVITGALKLFFRELPEPLFPFSHFNEFVTAIRNPDYNSKLSHIYELVKSLPPVNHDTMKLLFGHLQSDRVIEYGEDNRMTVQNVAIVFGPTLLRPETETANITMHMVFQNQIVEFILNEYSRLFYS
uniref:Rho GTPase activating protein 27 n=1 Tax=Poecilia formosa TaxID=48698 RepID=A0A087YES5_POEFO